MLSFEQKLAIADEFKELTRKDVSLGRVNYQFEGSAFDKKNVIYHLHRSGNGFVYAGRLDGYDTDDKGFANIAEFSEEQLRTIVAASIDSLRGEAGAASEPALEEIWRNEKRQTLELKYDDEDAMWYVYAGLNLDGAFDSYDEAAAYLKEEGFAKA
ncbi:hypothetical protein SAMN05216312_1208 [Cohnella sp. OV330]|uniref:hypothetical protein n=1 Tax=Cohnella sp. OV330 TaxID=1855288 RepID=UPI0008E4234F|nr:hypothetical protein [Cohnella sp. OV330]SFB62041.1 hypothetical protein SAMN05216312_1208 [Cohnella sp. OV330]